MLLIYAPIWSIYIFCLGRIYCSEQITESLFIFPLSQGKRVLLNYEVSFFINNDTKFEDPKFFPNEIISLLKIENIASIIASTAQGKWRDYSWGTPPIQIYPSGSLIDILTYNRHLLPDNEWNFLVNSIGGILCNSLDEMSLVKVQNNRCLKTEPNIELNNFNNAQIPLFRTLCTFPDDYTCSENFLCWKKLLPCELINSLGYYIKLEEFLLSPYKSIGIKFFRESKRFHLIIFFQFVLNSTLNSEQWHVKDIWTLLNIQKPNLKTKICPVYEKSLFRIYLGDYITNLINQINIPKTKTYMFSDKSLCNIINKRQNYFLDIELNSQNIRNGSIILDLTFLKERCNLYFLTNIQDLILGKTPNQVQISRHFTDIYGKMKVESRRESGKILLSFINNYDQDIEICHWDKFPRYLRPWFETINVEIISNILYSSFELPINKHIIKSYSGSQAILEMNLSFGLSKDGTTYFHFCYNIGYNTALIAKIEYRKLHVTLDEIGSSPEKGFHVSPSITKWRFTYSNIEFQIGTDYDNDINYIEESYKDVSSESDFFIVYHDSPLVLLPLVDPSMAFNIVAFTSSILALALVITSRLALSNENQEKIE
ncbi:hypothetical protein ACR3K2_21730 [Cryptosporidium serpentis]